MKNVMRAVPYIFFAIFIPTAVFFSGCSSNNAPNSPGSTANPTATPTFGFTVIPQVTCPATGICAQLSVQRSQGNVPSTTLQVSLQVSGAVYTTAAVTVSYGATSIPMTFATNSGNSSLYNAAAAWSYLPGTSYSVSITAAAYTANASLVAPGNITAAVNGSNASWTVEGNFDYVEVFSSSGFNYLSGFPNASDVNSPVSVPPSTYPSSDSYNFIVACQNAQVFYGTNSAVEIFATDVVWNTVNVSYTPTPTPSYTPSSPTATPTFTFTPTITYTPNNTDTPTLTPTLTFTFTPTPTFTPLHPFVASWTVAGGSHSTFYAPWGIGVDSQGYVYVADNGNSRVVKLNSSGTYVTEWGNSGNPGNQLGYPHGLAVDSSNNIYVVDANNSRIQKYTTVGGSVVKWGSFGAGSTVMGVFNSPDGIAVDSSNNVYVVDTNNYRVQKFTSTGSPVTQWGSNGAGNGQFANPLPIAVDPSNNVYVGDTGASAGHSMQKFDSNGNFLLAWDGGLSLIPRGLMAYTDGNIYVMDNQLDGMKVYTSGGVFFGQLGSYGSGNGQFGNGPRGIAHSASGTIYVCDTPNNRIEVFGP